MGKWVQKIKESDRLKLLTAWAAILLLIIILGISRLFYTVDVQKVGFAGYYFSAEAEENTVHYTLLEIPGDGVGAAGDEMWMTDGDRLEYKGEVYECNTGTFGIAEFYTYGRQQADSGYITFPNEQIYQFAYMTDSFLWTNMTARLEDNSMYLPISFREGELSRYPADMIAAVTIVQDEVEYNLEHPMVWEGMLTLGALLVLAVGTVTGLCDQLMNSLSIFRVRQYYDINGEVRPSALAISLRRICSAIDIFGGIVLLIQSFYFRS
ncbi:hypothetical protein [Clostridium sp. Marseille-P3244]|uniref:hypothetical protein n=1 Tax=Clostridium sp. Marseille-P3244 TaxID=1871020 RepID=UPI0009303004|nr:hypothetical protein [Clostridium sp. Marseille-P3244]